MSGLLDHRDQVVELIAGSSLATLAPELQALLQSRSASQEALRQANAERHEQTVQAILAAADRALTQRARAFLPQCHWSGLLHQWLERKHELVGLERAPHLRTVRAVLKNWEPPTGDAQIACSTASIRST